VGLLVIAFVLVVAEVVAQAQQPTKVPRIGFLGALDPSGEQNRSEAIRLALRQRGYIEGQNIAIEYRFAEGKRESYPALANELAGLKVDVIVVAGGNLVIRAAMNASKTIPIVMTGQGGDPVAAGFVESLARPGGNVTGLTNLSQELGGKRLELLKEAVPKLARVAVLYDPATSSSSREVKDALLVAARSLKLTVLTWEARDAKSLEKIFAAQNKERADGIYAPDSGPVMRANGKRIADFALKNRMPSVYDNREAVVGGGLLYYGVDRADSYGRVAYYLDRILKGTKPSDLPVEQPTKFELVINLKTAKQIGLTIPQSMLYRTDKVIR
jgi:putative ABC transport system substrate-binding protein